MGSVFIISVEKLQSPIHQLPCIDLIFFKKPCAHLVMSLGHLAAVLGLWGGEGWLIILTEIRPGSGPPLPPLQSSDLAAAYCRNLDFVPTLAKMTY